MCSWDVCCFAITANVTLSNANPRRLVCRRRVSMSADSVQEPEFFSKIRAVAPSVLQPRSLEIGRMEWTDTKLCVYITPGADVPMDTVTADSTSENETSGSGPSLQDCEFASTVLGDLLDKQGLIPAEEYTLEVSTLGAAESLTLQHEFEVFKGFGVTVRTSEVFKKKTEFVGALHDRTEDSVRINIKGRILSIPRRLVLDVRLDEPKEEE